MWLVHLSLYICPFSRTYFFPRISNIQSSTRPVTVPDSTFTFKRTVCCEHEQDHLFSLSYQLKGQRNPFVLFLWYDKYDEAHE